MSPRPRATFAKLQKERARQEKARAKAERRQQRKAEKLAQPPQDDVYPAATDEGQIQEEGNPEQ